MGYGLDAAPGEVEPGDAVRPKHPERVKPPRRDVDVRVRRCCRDEEHRLLPDPVRLLFAYVVVDSAHRPDPLRIAFGGCSTLLEIVRPVWGKMRTLCHTLWRFLKPRRLYSRRE